LLEYATIMLDDARRYSNYAKKKVIDGDDMKLAIQMAEETMFLKNPSREVRQISFLYGRRTVRYVFYGNGGIT